MIDVRLWARVRDGGGESLHFWFSTFLATWWNFPETFCLYTQPTVLPSHLVQLLREKESNEWHEKNELLVSFLASVSFPLKTMIRPVSRGVMCWSFSLESQPMSVLNRRWRVSERISQTDSDGLAVKDLEHIKVFISIKASIKNLKHQWNRFAPQKLLLMHSERSLTPHRQLCN